MMRRGLECMLASFLLGGLLLLPSRAVAQTEILGLKPSGEGEVGGRIFVDRPGKVERGKFEEYRDIPPGVFLERLRLRFESRDESYSLEFGAKDPGEQHQNFFLRSSKLGRYTFEFEWDQIPHVFSGTGRSPYHESPRGVFELSDLLQTTLQGASAAARPGILRSFLATASDIDLKTRWDAARFLMKFTPTPDWDLRAGYTHTQKEGQRPIGTTLSSFTNQVELPEPIDQTVHDFRMSAELARERWQLQFSYNLSVFQNDVDVLVWDNPLRLTDGPFVSSPTGGSSAPARGRLDLAPDNMAHTMGLTGGVNLPWRSRLTGTFSYGWRFQDDPFVPHTINTAIVDPRLALPAKSLDGEVGITLFNLRLTSRPLRDISLGARYRFYDFDDRTRNLTFPARVRTDTDLLTDPITSSRFSYTKHNGGADVGWRPLPPLSAKVGFDWERWDRDPRHREAPLTDEYTPKISLDYTPLDWLLLRTSYARSWRRINTYNPFAHLAHTVGEEEAVTEAPVAQSTLIRKYDEADRDRDRVDFLAQLTPFDTLTFTPTLSFRNDDFKNSPLGLQDDKSWAAGFDASWSPMARLSF
ncbi:MAG: MtrB/PioB family decaheme-associated outer membrane protein, partial [Nitrospinae bacterium]|nr:MtrB/PioB family decaheme-associated outer membrane protein [Nitrospinota bacterium]